MILFLQVLELLCYRVVGTRDLGTWGPGEGGTSAVLMLDEKIGRLSRFGAVSKQQRVLGKIYICLGSTIYLCSIS